MSQQQKQIRDAIILTSHLFLLLVVLLLLVLCLLLLVLYLLLLVPYLLLLLDEFAVVVGNFGPPGDLPSKHCATYRATIRPNLEYACQAWHTGLTAQQSNLLENTQRRSLAIAYPELSYRKALGGGWGYRLYSTEETFYVGPFSGTCYRGQP